MNSVCLDVHNDVKFPIKWIFNGAHYCEICMYSPRYSGLNGMSLSPWRPQSPHTPPSPPLPLKPSTPHPVSGGDQLCQSRQATHTHTRTHSALVGEQSPWYCQWRQAMPPRLASLLFTPPWGEGMTPLLLPFLIRKKTVFGGEEEPLLVYSGIFLSYLLLMSWDAGGAQREQQVGKITSGGWACLRGDWEFVYCYWWTWPWWLQYRLLKCYYWCKSTASHHQCQTHLHVYLTFKQFGGC